MDWQLIAIDRLPREVQLDLCCWIAERHPHFADRQDWTEVRDNLIGLADAPKVWVGALPVDRLHRTMERQPSEAAVARYRAMLDRAGFEFDPILVADGGFLDGGHRMEAYFRADRDLIPVVEVGHIVNAPAETWESWMAGDPEAAFVPPPEPPEIPCRSGPTPP